MVFIYSDTYIEISDHAVSFYKLTDCIQVRTTHEATQTLTYDRLAPSHPPLQLIKPHAAPVAAQRT
jgi:hypothetical protein